MFLLQGKAQRPIPALFLPKQCFDLISKASEFFPSCLAGSR